MVHKSASANGKNHINFGIGFSIDQASYNQTLQSLKKLQNITQDDITGKTFGSNAMQNHINKIKKSASDVQRIWKQAFNSDLGVLNIQKFNSLLNSSGLNLKKLGKDWASTGAVGASALRNLASATLTANMNLKRTDSLVNKIGTTFLNTIKWTFASSVINSFTGSLQQSFGYIKSLDSSLNDIRIVTGKSADEMSKFAVKANEAAKALGKQTTDYTNAALIYYQQGLGEEESNTLAETTLKVSNITGQNAKTVSEEITAVMNGYQLGADQVERAFDSLAAVAATTASDLSEISTGMSKVASTANMLGVPLDSLNAQLATIVSVTRQAPESVGTALKTIYARMNDLKLGKSDEDGIQLGDVSGSLEKMGIHILDEKKNLRDLGTVINEVAASWKTWTNEQRIAMAESLAGKRQYNNLIALFDNWDMYTKALNTSLSAQGTIAKQNGIYLDSLAAHMNQLKAAQEGVMDSFFDSKSFKGFIDFGTSALGILEKIIDALGGGGTILGSLAALVGRVFSNQISKEIANAVINLKNYNFNLQQIQGSMEALKNFQKINLSVKDDGTKKITDLKEQVMSFGNLITPEEQNQANAIIQKVNSLYQERDAWRQAYEAGREALAGTEKYIEIQELANQTETARKAAIDSSIKSIKERQDGYNKDIALLQKLQNIGKGSNAQDVGIKINSKQIEYLTQHFEELKNSTDIFTKDLGFSNKEVKGFYQTLGKLTGQTTITQKQIVAINAALKAMGIASNKATEGIKAFKGAENYLGDNFTNKVKAAQAQWNNFVSSLQTTQHVKQVVQLVSATGQLAMGFQTLTNIVNVVANDSIPPFQRMLQVITNIGFAFPQILAGAQGLGKVLASLNIIKLPTEEQLNKFKELGGIKEGIKGVRLSKKLSKLDFNIEKDSQIDSWIYGQSGPAAKALKKDQEIQKLVNAARAAGIKVTDDMKIGDIKLALATKQKTAEDLKQITAIKAKNLAMMAAPAIIFAVIAALNMMYQSQVKAAKAQTQAAKKQAQASQKLLDQTKEQAKKTEQLATSYKKLYEQYKNHTITQEEMRKSAYDLCKQYGDNNLVIQALSKSYKDLEKSIKDAQKAQNDKVIKEAKETIDLQGSAAKKAAIQYNKEHPFLTYRGAGRPDINGLNFSYFQKNNTSTTRDFMDKMSKLTGGFTEGTNGEIIGLDIEKNKDIIAKNINDIKKLINDYTGDINELYYKIFDGYFNGENGAIFDEIKANQETLKQSSLNNIVLDKLDKNTIKNSDDKVEAYKDTLKQMEDAAKEFFDTQAEAHDWALKQLADVEDTRKQYYINQIEEKVKNLPKETEDYINSLSEQDLALIISGKIEFLGKIGPDALKQALQALKQNLDPEDTSLAIQIRAGLAKGKDLNPEDIQALSTQTGISSLSESLDSGSVLDRLDRLKEATDVLNQSTKEYLATTKEQAQLELKSVNDKIERLKNEAEKIKPNSQGEAEELKKINEEIAAYEKLADTLKEVANRSLSQVDDAAFQYIRNEIDSIITKAEALKSAAEMIGEGFKVAASDVQQFASLYPELLDQATYTAEGQMVLNQQVVQDFVDKKKEQINADAEAKKSELNSQIAIYEARIKFDDAKIKALQDYLTTKKSESEIQEELTQATGEFQQDVAEALGVSQKELTDNALKNINTEADAMYDFLDKVLLEYEQVNAYASAALVGRAGGKPSLISAAKAELTGEAFASSQNVEDIRTLRGADNFDKRVAQLKQEYLQRQADIDHYNELKAALSGVESSQRASIAALNRVAAGQAGKGSSKGGGGSSKDPETKQHKDFSKDAIKDERDIYLEIDRIIQHTQKTLEKMQKTTQKLVGKDLEKALQEQQKLLAQQAANYEKKAEIAKEEQARLAEELAQKGFTFAENGELNNYNTAYTTNASRINAQIQAIQDEVNAAIDAYNTLDAAGQQAQKDMLEELEKNAEARVQALKNEWSTITDGVSKYNEAINTAQEAETAAVQAVEKQYQNMVALFEKKIKITIDFNQAKREFIKFRKDIVSNFSKETARGLGVLREAASEELKTLLTNENSDANTYANELAKAQGALERMRASGSTYDDQTGFTQEKAFEIAKDAAKNLMSSMTDAKEAIDELFNAWFDGWDKIEEKFDNQVKKFDFINDQLEHGKKLVTLLNGDKAYAQLDKYYNEQIQNDQLKLDMLKRQKQVTQQEMQRQKQLMSKMNEGTRQYEQAQKRYETLQNSWMDTVQELNSAIEQSIERLLDKYGNLWDKILTESKNSLTGGMDFNNASEEWQLVKKNADLYLDDINKGFETEKFNLAIEKALADTQGNIKAQKALNDLRDKELTKLKEKERITQYDVDRANALLTLEQKRIALEEAQNNKSKLRLRRDSQGNYSYQYTSDEEDIGDKRTDYLNAMQNVYNMDNQAYRNNLDMMQAATNEYYSKMSELREAYLRGDDTALERMRILNEQYQQYITSLAQENTDIRKYLTQSAGESAHQVYKDDETYFGSMIDYEVGYLDTKLVPGWNGAIQNISDFVNGEGGFLPITQGLTKGLTELTANYRGELDKTADAAGRDFTAIDEGLDEIDKDTKSIIGDVKQWTTDNGELVKSMQAELVELGKLVDLGNGYIDVLNNMAGPADVALTKWQSLEAQIEEATRAMQLAREEAQKPIVSPTYNVGGVGDAGAATPNPNGGGDGGGYGGGSPSYSSPEPEPAPPTATIQDDPQGAANTLGVFADGRLVKVEGYSYNVPYVPPQAGSAAQAQAERSAKNQAREQTIQKLRDWANSNGYVAAFASGGYTGKWDNGDKDGRLAMLHQKELVLNADDTKNILSAVDIVRTMRDALNFITSDSSLPNFAKNLASTSSSSQLEQNVHITATFPNVVDRNEIQIALENLTSKASQYINRH